MRFVFDDKMINYQCILMKNLFYYPYEIIKHSFINIDFIASVYELFNNPSYMTMIMYLRIIIHDFFFASFFNIALNYIQRKYFADELSLNNHFFISYE